MTLLAGSMVLSACWATSFRTSAPENDCALWQQTLEQHADAEYWSGNSTCQSTKFEALFTCAGRYEVDKLSASQRLDLNLEKGRMRDELQVRVPMTSRHLAGFWGLHQGLSETVGITGKRYRVPGIHCSFSMT